MNEILPYIVIGIASGSVYSLAGVGLVLTYKTSGIFNFAQGAMASIAAFSLYIMRVQYDVPLPIAIFVAVVILAIAMGLAFEPFAARLAHTPLPVRVAATVGVLLAVDGLIGIFYSDSTEFFPTYLPTGTYDLGGVKVGYDQTVIVAISVACVVALFVFFRYTSLGKAMRALVDDPSLMSLIGLNPRAVRRAAWIIGCFFITLSGLLLCPGLPVNGDGLTLLVVQAFGAAAIGGFTHLGRTWAGGIIVGIAAALATKYGTLNPSLAGLAASVPFIILFLVLSFSRRFRDSAAEKPAASALKWNAPVRFQVLIGFLALAFLAYVPQFAGFQIGGWTVALTYVVLFLSLGLLVRHSGQVSLSHVTFAAIGAVAFSQFALDVRLPWLVSLLLAGAVVVPVGAVLAIPAIRSSGLYLAIATFGFGLVVQNLFYSQDFMFGSTSSGRLIPIPEWDALGISGSDDYYYVVLAITVLTSVVVVALVRSRLGRLLRALADAPVALAALGATSEVTRMLVFCISAFLAGIAGALFGGVLTIVTATSFDPLTSLSLATLIVISVGGPPWYALLAGLGYAVLPAYLGGDTTFYLQVLFGVSAIVYACGPEPKVPGFIAMAIDRLFGKNARISRFRLSLRGYRRHEAAVAQPRRVSARGGDGLVVADLNVRFGGIKAVTDLSIRAPMGAITGLIGPNGAGKTTTFNSCTGLNSPTSGSVSLNGRQLNRHRPASRARMGLGRTFQRMELFDSLSVAENVALGREATVAGANPFWHVFSTRSQRRHIAGAAADAIRLCDLSDLVDTPVGALSTGKRRLVELARCVAGEFDFLLLDEPSSGLDTTETKRFAEILRTLCTERGIGMLLVEHDMGLVMDICSNIYVLDFGALIFEGSPSEVMTSRVVQAAYLGDAAALHDVAGDIQTKTISTEEAHADAQ